MPEQDHRDGPGALEQRAALYCRVSTEEQAEEGQSIAAQLRLLEEHCARHRLRVVERFIDEGFSATTDRRPAFQRMIAMAKLSPRPFDLILVHKMDRFARNREHAIIYKNLLRRECGVDVLSITERFDDSPQGRLMEGILEVMAEFYSANLGQEVRKGMLEKARRGAALGQAPVGYRIGAGGRLEPVPGAADAVRWMFETYAAGRMGYVAIARILRTEGRARFPGLPPLKWSAQAVRQILRNEAYLGRRIWNRRNSRLGGRLRPEDQWVVVDGAHPAIVQPELFAQVRARMDRHPGPPGSMGDYLLRGLVRCEECGAAMYRRRLSASRGGTGNTLILSCSRYYRGDGTCYFNWVTLAEISQALGAHLRPILDGADLSHYTFAPPPEDRTEADALQRALEQCAARYRRQIEAYEAGVLDLTELRTAKERVAAERAALEERLRQVHSRRHAQAVPEQLVRERAALVLSALDPGIGDGPGDDVTARRAILNAVVAGLTYSRRLRRLRITLRV